MSEHEKSILLSFSDGLGPSIYFRKMEQQRLLKEKMDGKVYNSDFFQRNKF